LALADGKLLIRDQSRLMCIQVAMGTNNNMNAQNKMPQQIYLWEKGNVPTTTEYTVNNSGYFDPPDFRPNMVYFPAKQGVTVKGAVLVCAGGAFQFRNDRGEGTPVAQQLSELGYQSLVVHYRLRP